MLTKRAGACFGKRTRHTWGKEETLDRGAFRVRMVRRCQHCARVQVIVYGKRGNHVQGYYDT